METILASLINITLYPFTSRTYFVILPCMLCFVSALFSLVYRMIRGRY